MHISSEEFISSIKNDSPPNDISLLLEALWYDAKGDWESAHEIAQEIENCSGALLHAYLHRKEGDQSNARYWYSHAGSKPFKGSLEEEWQSLLQRFISI